MSKRQSAAAKAKAEALQDATKQDIPKEAQAAATETQAAAVTEGEVPAVTVAAKAKAKAELTADPEPEEPEVLTVENCTHFQNRKGRIFPATEVLRRLARRQDLTPVAAPK